MRKYVTFIACLAMALSAVTFTSCEKDDNSHVTDTKTVYTISHNILGDLTADPNQYLEQFSKFVGEMVGREAEVGCYSISTYNPKAVEKALATITSADLKRIAKQVNTSIYYVNIKIRKGTEVILDLSYSKSSNEPTDHVGTYTYTENGKTFSFTMTATPTNQEGYYVSTFTVPNGFEGIEPGTYTGGTRAYGYTHVQYESDKRNEAGTTCYLKVVLDMTDAESGTYIGNIGVNGKSWKTNISFTKQ